MNRIRLSTSRDLGVFARCCESVLSQGAALSLEIIAGIAFLLAHTMELAGHPGRGAALSLQAQLEPHRHWISDTFKEEITPKTGRLNRKLLLARCTGLLGELNTLVTSADLATSVTESYGVVRLSDHAKLNLVVLGTIAQRASLEISHEAWAEITRTLAALLGQQRPGRSIEVRIPPFAAVQLGALSNGPVHRRGTPPAVVETDPATFLALCSGDLGWQQALAEHRLTKSGSHADEVASLLPLFAPLPA